MKSSLPLQADQSGEAVRVGEAQEERIVGGVAAVQEGVVVNELAIVLLNGDREDV